MDAGRRDTSALQVAEDLAATLRRLEEDLLRPEIRGSAVELEARLAPDFVEIGSSGRVYDRAAIVAALAAETANEQTAADDRPRANGRDTGDDRAPADDRPRAHGGAPAAVRIEGFAVRLLAADVALATYRSVRDGAEGRPAAAALRASIWRRDGGAWRMAFHQGTPTG